MLEGLKEDPNAFSAVSLGMLDGNERAEAAEIKLLDPQVPLH